MRKGCRDIGRQGNKRELAPWTGGLLFPEDFWGEMARQHRDGSWVGDGNGRGVRGVVVVSKQDQWEKVEDQRYHRIPKPASS